MSGDGGYEPFNLDNDFEGGKWINGEFFYDSKREKRKYKKEDSIYGVFGEGSDSEEDSRSTKRSKKDYSAPLSFISSGKSEPTKEVKEEREEKSEHSRSESKSKDNKSQDNATATAAGTKKKKAVPELSEHELNANYGIGHKLLKSMGWKGGSLKEDRGLAEPIQVKLRPKNQGLSYGDFSERTDQSLRHFQDLDEEPQDETDAMDTEDFTPEQPREQHWKRSAPKRKTVYKTVEEVMGGKAQSAQQVILDMRGPQVKVLSGANQISQRDIITRSSFLPELRSNVALLVDVKEGQIHSIDQRRRHEENVLKGLKREEFNLKQQLEMEEGEIQRVEDILTIVNKCQDKLHSTTDQLTLEFVAKIFDLLKNKFVEEWNKYQLESLAYIFVFPLLKQHLGAWDPTKDQQLGPRLVSAWYTLLSDSEDDEDDRRHRRVTPWTRLLSDVVLPRLTEWFNREWNARDAAAGLNLIAAWDDVLPPEARDHVIENSLLPRLRREVERWNPTKDPQPLSQWLVPWRVVLGSRLHQLGEVLKPTLMSALTAWHPADQSALALLRPLRVVWDQHTWESLLLRVILPKLSLAMREFIVNPQQQVIDGFQWVINWHDLVPAHLFIPIFEFEFFPKWFNVLHLWLSTSPNYEEVMRWYMNWKKMFPEELQTHERIRDKFNYALELMNAVLSGAALPPLDITRIQPPVPIQAPKVEVPVTAPVKRVPLSEALTFREMIERLADDNGLGFVPTKKQHDGKPIYMFGSVPIIVDKDLILTQVGSQWRPSSIESLLKQVQQ